MSYLAQLATTSVVTQRTTYGTNQTQAARDVNRLEYEQRVQGLQAEMVQTRLKQEQAGLEAQRLGQQNQQSYAQGLYQVLQQRVAAQEQAYAGKEQGMQVQGAHAQEATQMYQQMLNQALELEASMQQEQNKAAQASLMTDPLTATNVVNDRANLQSQLQAFIQNRMQQNQGIGEEAIQNEYTNTIADIMRRLGINDSQLTTTMADINESNISKAFNDNNQQIQQQSQLNNQAFNQAVQGLSAAQQQEYQRYRSDDQNITRLAQAQNQQASNQRMQMQGYTYDGTAWRQNSSSPWLSSPLETQGSSSSSSTSSFNSPTFNSNFGGSTQTRTQQPQQQSLWLSNRSELARENIMRADPNAVIIMPEDLNRSSSVRTQPANTSRPPENAQPRRN